MKNLKRKEIMEKIEKLKGSNGKLEPFLATNALVLINIFDICSFMKVRGFT